MSSAVATYLNSNSGERRINAAGVSLAASGPFGDR